MRMHLRPAFTCVSVAFATGLFSGAPALGQATTEKQPPTAPAPPTFQPARDRDAAGIVQGPGRVGWWNDAVFYELFVRSFSDSTTGPLANDGIGDIQGMIDHLDYLNDGDPKTDTDLGITGIWLMPVMESPSYHGYDITDYRKIEHDYGTNEDFTRLVAECHKRGIRVIIDLVMNHCSSQHPWFVESMDPKSDKHDWFIWTDAAPPSDFKGPWGQKVWWPKSRGDSNGPFYYGLFGANMPDINYRNKAASDEMLGVVKFWLNDAGGGIDGYRLDAIRHLIEEGRQQDNTLATHEWLKSFHAFYKGENKDAMCIGEVWASTEAASSYVAGGAAGQMDMTFEFELAQAMVDSAKSGDASRVKTAQEKVLKWFPPNQYGRFLTNHDQARVIEQLKHDPGAMRAAAAMLLLGPGVPFIYYGEEIGMAGEKPDPDIRTPMQWSPGEDAGFSSHRPWHAIYRDSATVNVETQSRDPDSLLNFYKKLIRLRRDHAAIARGGFVPVESGSKQVYAFAREGEDETLIVAINLSDKPVTDCALSCQRTHGRGTVSPTAIFGKLPKSSSITLDPRGGFTGWKPIAELAPHEVLVLPLKLPATSR